MVMLQSQIVDFWSRKWGCEPTKMISLFRGLGDNPENVSLSGLRSLFDLSCTGQAMVDDFCSLMIGLELDFGWVMCQPWVLNSPLLPSGKLT